LELIRIRPKHFPVPVAPFSYGINVKGGSLFLIPNLIPVDLTGHVVGKGDIVAQATQVFENLKSLLAVKKAGFERIVKITWYLTTRENWRPVVEVRNGYFRDTWPAATFVLLDRLSREDVLFELNAIAVVD
jgi:2-iminobutanoate/2-iminopropanoate deaminase